MIKKFNQYLKENYNQTSWSDIIDGVKRTINISDIEKYLINEDIIEIPVNKIKNMCCHLGKTDELTIRRSNLSSLEYPIIISKDINGNYNMILDGHHRLLKAINNNIETIKARVLDLITAPKLYQNMFGYKKVIIK
jgi:hypothetical protein